MSTYTFVRALPAFALVGALGVCLMGATTDTMGSVDSSFAPAAMNLVTQSIANAEAVQSGTATPDVTKLAVSIQRDELDLGTQLASLADFYGVSLKTDLPKEQADTASFAQDQVTALAKLISLLDTERTGGSAAQLRTLAADEIPVLQKDLDAAKAAAK
jgi:hypothetical protein